MFPKIVVFGQRMGGKSTLFNALQEAPKPFSRSYRMTIGGDLRTIVDPNSRNNKLDIVDASPDDVFDSHYRSATIGIYCIDLSSPINISVIQQDITKFKARSPIAKIIFVGTKLDLVTDPDAQVSAMKTQLKEKFPEDCEEIFAFSLKTSLDPQFKKELFALANTHSDVHKKDVYNRPRSNHQNDIDLNKLMAFPMSYQKLFNLGTLEPQNPLLAGTRALLDDYTKGSTFFFSTLNRYVCGHVNRNHVSDVSTIVKRIDKGELDTVEEVLEALEVIKRPNPRGSLQMRMNFIRNCLEETKQKAALTTQQNFFH